MTREQLQKEIDDLTIQIDAYKERIYLLKRTKRDKKEQLDTIAVHYCIGDRFCINDTDEYILAQNGLGQVLLVNTNTGTFWRSPIEVDDFYEITEDELRRIIGIRYPWKRTS